MLAHFFLPLVHRLSAAFTTVPDLESWCITAALIGIYSLISLPIGFKFDFIHVEIQASQSVVIGVMLAAILSPAIAEELLFRVLLLPHASEHPSLVTLGLWGTGSLVLFILYHPLEGMSFYPQGFNTFINPVFLVLATLLGIVCTIAYWQSGSIWPPAFIHWLVVVVWLLVLGGYQKLNKL